MSKNWPYCSTGRPLPPLCTFMVHTFMFILHLQFSRTLTVLFQDDVGGLEVETADGKFIPAVPIEGTVVINIGDLMQRWTSDVLRSTVSEYLRSCSPYDRNSFFVKPSNFY